MGEGIWLRRGTIALASLALGVTCYELASFAGTQDRLVDRAAWDAMAAHLKPKLRASDLILAAPSYRDPLLRSALGSAIAVDAASYSDFAAYDRVFEVSLDDASAVDAPRGTPSALWLVGAFRIRRWELGTSPVLYRFRDHLADAKVALVHHGTTESCRWQTRPAGQPGGVHRGVMPPQQRHKCPGAPWLWVGTTVIEDLTLQPRSCIWQHPPEQGASVATFSGVPLGDRLVIYGGLFYDHEVAMNGAPVEVDVHVNGAEVETLVHLDGDGWKRWEIPIKGPYPSHGTSRARGEVSIHVRSDNPSMRSFCWTGSLRRGPRREAKRGRLAR